MSLDMMSLSIVYGVRAILQAIQIEAVADVSDSRHAGDEETFVTRMEALSRRCRSLLCGVH
jgi:hypothetical protein